MQAMQNSGPFKVVPSGDRYKVVRVIGQYPPLSLIEQRLKAALQRRPRRPSRHSTPSEIHDAVIFTMLRPLAEKDIVQDVDDGKCYSKGRKAYRRCLILNKAYLREQEHQRQCDESEHIESEAARRHAQNVAMDLQKEQWLSEFKQGAIRRDEQYIVERSKEEERRCRA